MKKVSKILLLGALICGTMAWGAKCNVNKKFGAISIEEDGNDIVAVFDGESFETVDIPKSEQCEADRFVIRRPDLKPNKATTMMFPFVIGKDCFSSDTRFFTVVGFVKGNGSWPVRDTVKAKEHNTSQLEANTPYFLYPNKEGTEIKSNASDKSCREFTLGTELGNKGSVSIVGNDGKKRGWIFKGSFEYRKWKKGDSDLGRVYGLTAYDIDNNVMGQNVEVKAGTFIKVAAGSIIRPLRAYMVNNNEGDSGWDPNLWEVRAKDGRNPRLVNEYAAKNEEEEELPEEIVVQFLNSNGELAGISTLNPRTGEISESKWFDAKGRDMKQKPTTKGSYYHNGQKVTIK